LRTQYSLLTDGALACRGARAKPLFETFKTTQVRPTQEIRNLIAGAGEGTSRVPGLEDLDCWRKPAPWLS